MTPKNVSVSPQSRGVEDGRPHPTEPPFANKAIADLVADEAREAYYAKAREK
jgi:hypothetical protein